MGYIHSYCSLLVPSKSSYNVVKTLIVLILLSLSSTLRCVFNIFAFKGHMQWLWDNNDKRYLDLFAGIVTVSVGHCHP